MDDATACYDWGIPHTSYSYSCQCFSTCTAAKHGSPRTRTRTRRIIQHHPHTHSSRSTPYIYKVFQHLLQWLVVIRMQLHQISSLCQTPNLAKRQGFCDDNDSGVRTHSYDCSPQIKYVKHIIYVWSGYGSMSLKWMRGPYHNSMIHVKNLHTHLQLQTWPRLLWW
jgi:hypothetical protein